MNTVIETIKLFVESVEQGYIEYKENDKTYKIWAAKYLLGQIVRQYAIPDSHILISKEAYNLWNAITSDEMIRKGYQDTVICNKLEGEKTVTAFRGNARKKKEDIIALKLIKNSSFAYRQVFHDEHIVPINDIIEELIALKKEDRLTDENIKNTLDKIYICKMLKIEDAKINKRYHRGSTDYKEVLSTVYHAADIDVVYTE